MVRHRPPRARQLRRRRSRSLAGRGWTRPVAFFCRHAPAQIGGGHAARACVLQPASRGIVPALHRSCRQSRRALPRAWRARMGPAPARPRHVPFPRLRTARASRSPTVERRAMAVPAGAGPIRARASGRSEQPVPTAPAVAGHDVDARGGPENAGAGRARWRGSCRRGDSAVGARQRIRGRSVGRLPPKSARRGARAAREADHADATTAPRLACPLAGRPPRAPAPTAAGTGMQPRGCRPAPPWCPRALRAGAAERAAGHPASAGDEPIGG